MNDKNGINPIVVRDHNPQVMPLGILGATLAGFCSLFIAAFFLFQPDQLSLSDQYFPSPTATLTSTPTPTSTRTPTPTPNATATQQALRSTATAQVIQALATDSFHQWPVIFSDTFDSNENTWMVGSDEDEYAVINREIANGKYTWDATAKIGFISWFSPAAKSVGDFNLTADLKRARGSSQSDYGLIFRECARSNFYYFGINNEVTFVMRITKTCGQT